MQSPNYRFLRGFCSYSRALMISITAENTPIIASSGIMYFSHLLKVVPAISKVTSIRPVGVINAISPCPQLYALITSSLERPAVSAKGAIIGTERMAKPEGDGIKKPKTEKITSWATAKTPLFILVTASVE